MSAAVAAAAAAALANRRNSTTSSAATTSSATTTSTKYNYNSYTNLHHPPSLQSRRRLSRYELQKREDWDAFGQYLKNHHHPPVSTWRCSGAHVVEFLRYLDQFGETKVHNHSCMFFGQAYAPAACPCPLKQAWSSLDALVGRLRAAFEEHGGSPKTNPFRSPEVWLYLREVKESQSKARGIAYG